MSFRDNQAVISIIETKKEPYLFSTKQLISIVESITSVKTRITLVGEIGPRLIDPKEHADELLSLFRFADEKEKIEEVLKARQTTLSSSHYVKSAGVGMSSRPSSCRLSDIHLSDRPSSLSLQRPRSSLQTLHAHNYIPPEELSTSPSHGLAKCSSMTDIPRSLELSNTATEAGHCQTESNSRTRDDLETSLSSKNLVSDVRSHNITTKNVNTTNATTVSPTSAAKPTTTTVTSSINKLFGRINNDASITATTTTATKHITNAPVKKCEGEPQHHTIISQTPVTTATATATTKHKQEHEHDVHGLGFTDSESSMESIDHFKHSVSAVIKPTTSNNNNNNTVTAPLPNTTSATRTTSATKVLLPPPSSASATTTTTTMKSITKQQKLSQNLASLNNHISSVFGGLSPDSTNNNTNTKNNIKTPIDVRKDTPDITPDISPRATTTSTPSSATGISTSQSLVLDKKSKSIVPT